MSLLAPARDPHARTGGGRHAAAPDAALGATPTTVPDAAPDAVVGTPPAAVADQVTEEIRVTRRALRDPVPAGWSLETRRLLLGIAVVTLVLCILLVARLVSAQGVRGQGAEDAAALDTALAGAVADTAALTAAVEAATPVAADARALAGILEPRRDDLSAAAVDEVARAVEALAAAVAEPIVEPALPTGLASPASLPGRYVAEDGEGRSALRSWVATEVDRLGTLGDRALDRAAELPSVVAAVSEAAGGAVRAAEAAAPGILAAGPEATADARAALEQAVAALVALGDTPAPDAATRDAFTAYFAAADAFRLSHEQAVAARIAAEQAAAEAAAEAAAQEAAEAAAAENPWWRWWDRQDPRPPRDD